MRAMISQPMNGFSDEEILNVKERATATLKEMGYEVINSFFDDEWNDTELMIERGIQNIPLHFLADSLKVMSNCNAVYFCKGWENARGCKLEHLAAENYGLIIYEEEA